MQHKATGRAAYGDQFVLSRTLSSAAPNGLAIAAEGGFSFLYDLDAASARFASTST